MLKISGELFRESSSITAITHQSLKLITKQILMICELGIELGIIVGGGNIFRGHTYNGRGSGFTRVDADKMGMLATAINALGLRDALEREGVSTFIQSALSIEGIISRFSIYDTEQALRSGKVVIFCCGTGNPCFSTDSAAALRAYEIGADILLKASTVDGVYDSDPRKNLHAKGFKEVSYQEVLERKLRIMDLTAFVICMENGIPIRIFSGQKEDGIIEAIRDPSIGTFIGDI
jgi:uridylate kinase